MSIKYQIQWLIIFSAMGVFSYLTLMRPNYETKTALAAVIEKQGIPVGAYNKIFVYTRVDGIKSKLLGNKQLCFIGQSGANALKQKYPVETFDLVVGGKPISVVEIDTTGISTSQIQKDIQDESLVQPNCHSIQNRNFFYTIFGAHVS